MQQEDRQGLQSVCMPIEQFLGSAQVTVLEKGLGGLGGQFTVGPLCILRVKVGEMMTRELNVMNPKTYKKYN